MTTLTAFVNGYNKTLSQHLADELHKMKKSEWNEEAILALIKACKHGFSKATPTKSAPKSNTKTKKADESSEDVDDDFEAFGKFKSMAVLQKAHDKAVSESKYVNAKTGSVVQDSKANRNKGVLFYDSNVCGDEGSEELEAILKHFPGSIIEAEETPVKKTPKKEVDLSDEAVNWESFGKWSAKAKWDKALDKAVVEGKYVNVNTCSVIADNKRNRNSGLVFYDSNICGKEDSDELARALELVGGEVVEAEETPAKKSPTPPPKAKNTKTSTKTPPPVPAKNSKVVPSDGFVKFGKFFTKDKLDGAVEKAKESGKYVNVNKASLIVDNAKNRASLVLYDSGIAGIADSKELTEALKHYPGSVVNEDATEFKGESPKAKEPKSSATKAPKKTAPTKADKPKIVLNKHPLTKQAYIVDLECGTLAAWDTKKREVFGVVDEETGVVHPLTCAFAAELEKLNIKHSDVDDVEDEEVEEAEEVEEGEVEEVEEANVEEVEEADVEGEEGGEDEVIAEGEERKLDLMVNGVKTATILTGKSKFAAIDDVAEKTKKVVEEVLEEKFEEALEEFSEIKWDDITRDQFETYESAESEEESGLEKVVLECIQTNYDEIKKKFSKPAPKKTGRVLKKKNVE